MKMHKLTIFFFLATTFLMSCSSSDDPQEPETKASWKIGNYTYELGTSTQSIQNGVAVIVASTISDNSQGNASGSALTFILNDLGEGQYDIVESGKVALNTSEKLIEISCTIGTATVNATRYDTGSSASGQATVSKNGNTYTVSLNSGVRITKSVEVGTGVPDAEDEYTLTAKNIK